jgi:dihydroflavonol-4-reductase
MVFVTGGTGLVGSHLLAELISKGEEEILALKRQSSKLDLIQRVFSSEFHDPKAQLQKIKWVDGDLKKILKFITLPA